VGGAGATVGSAGAEGGVIVGATAICSLDPVSAPRETGGMNTRPPWCARSVIFGTLMLAIALDAGPVFAQQAAGFGAPLGRAQRAYAAGHFRGARAAFVQADAAIGEERFDDAGNSLYTPAERAARESMRCAWGLSTLASLGAEPRGHHESAEDGWAREAAISRAAAGCPPAERAVAADMLGSPLAAALLLREAGASAFPAPFASRALSEAARTFAGAQTGDMFPAARDVREATRFVLAATMAQHGLRANCGDAHGIHWTRPGQTLDAVDWDSEEDPEVPPPAFNGRAPDALALLRCEHPPVLAPEAQGFGDGATGIAFVLRRDASGSVSVVGSFEDFPSLDCWTGVVQREVANYPVPGSAHLYAFVRAEGAEGYDDDQPSYVATTAFVCDLERRACRSLPIQVERTAVEFHGHEVIPHRSSWRARLVVAQGRVRVSTVRGAPRAMRRFARGVPLDEFFSSESTSSWESRLYPEHTGSAAERATPSDCPWQIADPDGQTNVRPEPTTRGDVIGTIPTGTPIVPIERRGRWWRVDAPTAGWIWAPNVRQVCP